MPLLFVTDAVTDVDDLVTSAWASATNGWRTAVRWGPAVAEAWLPVSTINIVDADKLNRATVVDVRQETEYANGHLPGALHLELGALPGTAGSLPSGRPVVAMCAKRAAVDDRHRRRAPRRHERSRRVHRVGRRLGGPDRSPPADGAVTAVPTDPQVRLGLRENAAQFTLLVAVNALVGGMVGQQQTMLPLLAEEQFGLTGYSLIFAYVAAFGITKAATNYLAGGPGPPR